MKVYLYLLDTLSDWEIGYITAELNTGRFFKEQGKGLKIIKPSHSLAPIKTMGGIEILPDDLIENIVFEANDVLILPGADTWMDGKNGKVLKMIDRLLSRAVIVAAICGATIALASTTILNNRKHTSNNLEYLQSVCPDYSGSSFYSDTPAVSDRNLITASGLAPLEFSYEVFQKTGLFEETTLDAWFNLHQKRESKYFYDLMNSLQ
ncbi:MAG: DJ-1/PfpI family protein [Candidatus Ozemobacteraceae bacterium]